MKRRLLTLLVVVCLVAVLVPLTVSAEAPQNGWQNTENGWTYYRDGNMVQEEVIQIGGVYYGFDWDGYMYDDEAFECDGYWYRAKAGGALLVNKWYLDSEGFWYYYGAEGKAPEDFTKLGSVWYYFWNGGQMASNEMVWSTDYQGYFAINKAGTDSKRMNTVGWHQVYGAWYYMYDNGTEIIPAWDEMKAIGGKTYYFTHRAQMATNDVFYYWDEAQEETYAIAVDSNGYVVENGWCVINGNTHYAENYKLYEQGIFEIDGKHYLFEGSACLVKNEVRYDVDQYGNEIFTIYTEEGYILENGWGKCQGGWYYAVDGDYYKGGIHEIGANLYLFDYSGRMVDVPGDNSSFTHPAVYVKADGTLMRNQWRKDTTGYEYTVGWVYYGNDGRKLANTTVQIGGKWYNFDYAGIMRTEYIAQVSGVGVMVFDANGYGTVVDGWFEHPKNNGWMYYAEDGFLAEGWRTIDGKTYYFERGYRLTNQPSVDESDGQMYLLDANGCKITTGGWKKLDGKWYYTYSDGSLALGFNTIGGKLYYLQPEMLVGGMEHDGGDGRWYIFDANGVGTALTGTGFKSIGNFRVYVENGQPVQEQWRYIGGAWYYFWYDGEPYAGGAYEIDGKLYLFDANGKMHTSGWLTISEPYDGSKATFYAGSDGVAYTGWKTIGSKQYYFSEYGYLNTWWINEIDGDYYMFNPDGSLRASLNEGWNKIGDKWYYFDDYYLNTDVVTYIDGFWYGFDKDGAMLSSGIYSIYGDNYYFDANGHAVSGWIQLGGKWYYGDPDTDHCLYWDGIYYIDGVEYLFKNGYIQGGYYYSHDGYFTANAAGVVTGWKEYPMGWSYANNQLVYRNANPTFTGWVGDYYIENGSIVFEDYIEYNGNYYYLGKDGRYVKSGWYKTNDGNYVYAKAGGVLACTEWLKMGNTYYYFDDVHMAAGLCEIDGKYHNFDRSGKWLGEVNTTPTSSSNGWKQIGGNWYYFSEGQALTGMRYIGGNWYCFTEYGNMVTNGVGSNGMYGSKLFYFGASGARMNAVGWKQIDGEWLYFFADHSLANGLLQDGNKIYYLGWKETSKVNGPVMLTNTGYTYYTGELYLFNGSGYCTGPATGNGWRQAGSEWYYLTNGIAACETTMKIGNKLYAFDSYGRMVTNDIWNDYNGNIYFFGADGTAVTTSGWRQTAHGEWAYILADGTACNYGIYKIGNATYSFKWGCWVQ